MNEWSSWIMAGAVLCSISLMAAIVLGWANVIFKVRLDPRLKRIAAALPGANCGGCGFVGCTEYAEAVLTGVAPPDRCPAGGAGTATEIGMILGQEIGEFVPNRAIVHCSASFETRLRKAEYRGEKRCASANLVGGVQDCSYGCLGFGDCANVCPFDAINVEDGLASIDYEKCTGCGACADSCPRSLIQIVPFHQDRMLVVACSNKDRGPDVRAVCRQGCIACQACARKSGLFSMKDNLAEIDYLNYDVEDLEAAHAAMDICPMTGIVEVGRPQSEASEPPDVLEAPEAITTIDQTDWRG